MEFIGNHDTTVPAPLTETVQVSFSKPRCWHGENVTIRVRTGRVKNGSNIEVRVFAQGAGASFELLQNTIQDQTLDIDYKLNFKNKGVPANTTAIEATARVVELNITSARSAPMLVDLVPPLFSA